MLTTILIIVGGFILLASILSIADNLLQIEAKKSGIDTAKENMSLFPRIGDLFKKKAPSFAKDNYHSLTKGHNIKLSGEAQGPVQDVHVNRFAIQPPNFRGIAPIPKMEVNIGDEVKAGDVLFHDKANPAIKYTSPVSGELVELNRGEKRSISEIVILADKEQKHKKFDVPSLEGDTVSANIKDTLMEAGLWPLINARPFDVIADPTVTPRDIFISGFNTAPLSPDMDIVVDGRMDEFQKGIDVLNHLTDGTVFLSLGVDNKGGVLASTNNAEIHWFSGPHPAGNVGVQIHHISPIKMKDVVWTLDVQDVISIGNLFKNGTVDLRRVVALTGASMNENKFVRTSAGANIGELVGDSITVDNYRIVAGNVLTGKETSTSKYLNISDNQITVLKEGDEHELFGWLLPVSPRPSVSGTFPNFLFPNFKFDPDTNTHGEKRAFVVTGEYERMLPMDIYPQHIMKAIMSNDYERMEGLGILELSEEDVALCEFACTSKQPLQSILRTGLDMMREQM